MVCIRILKIELYQFYFLFYFILIGSFTITFLEYHNFYLELHKFSNIYHEVLSKDPDIRIYHNFLTDEESTELISLSRPLLMNSTIIINGHRGYVIDNSIRTSSSAHFELSDCSLIYKIEKRVLKLLNLTHSNVFIEPIQVVNYKEGQEFKPHFDWFGKDSMTREVYQR